MRNRRRNCPDCCETKSCPSTYYSSNTTNMPIQMGTPVNLFSTFNPMSGGSDPVSYASFWNTCSIQVPAGEDFKFNQAGICTPDILLVSPGTIKVCNSGVYKISYRVNVRVQGIPNSTELINNRVSLYVNCMQVPNGQVGFAIQAPNIISCIPLNGDALVFLPANACLNLVNESQCVLGSTITTCTSGGNTVTLSLFRVN